MATSAAPDISCMAAKSFVEKVMKEASDALEDGSEERRRRVTEVLIRRVRRRTEEGELRIAWDRANLPPKC